MDYKSFNEKFPLYEKDDVSDEEKEKKVEPQKGKLKLGKSKVDADLTINDIEKE